MTLLFEIITSRYHQPYLVKSEWLLIPGPLPSTEGKFPNYRAAGKMQLQLGCT